MYYYIINDRNLEFLFSEKWWLVRSDKKLPAKNDIIEVGIDGYAHLEYLYIVSRYKKTNYFWTFGQFRYGKIIKQFDNAPETIDFLKSIEYNDTEEHSFFNETAKKLCDIYIKAIADTV